MFEVSERWKGAYPDAMVAMLVVRGVANVKEHPALEMRKRALEGELRSRFANPEDIKAAGLSEGERVRVKNATGKLERQKVQAFPIRSGNIMMYYPEANVLVPRRVDPASKTPSFKSISVVLEKDPA